MWALAQGSGGLDVNSPYAYLLFAHHFSDTCILAESEGEAAGFVLGFRPPKAPDALFVWQITVAPGHRGQGVGVEMLKALLDRLADGVRYLEATVTPSNVASQSMFKALARRMDAPYEEDPTPLFPGELFPNGEHEEERAIRIGPITQEAVKRDPSVSRVSA